MNLKNQRLALNLTQTQLADLFGVSSTTIARWERGEVKPDAPGMLELALESLQMRSLSNNSEFIEKRKQIKAKVEETLETARKRVKH